MSKYVQILMYGDYKNLINKKSKQFTYKWSQGKLLRCSWSK